MTAVEAIPVRRLPALRNVRVRDLGIDPEVQRVVDPRWVAARVDQFSEAALGVLHVSEREDGFLHIIDGQHRRDLLIAAGRQDDTVRCLVYVGLSKQDEALMFRVLNDRRGVHPLDLFRVRVIEGDQVAGDLARILAQYGWRVGGNSKSKWSFTAVRALENVYHGDNKGRTGATKNLGVCAAVIGIISEAWDGDPDGVRAEIVEGLGALIVRHGTKVRVDKLVKQMQTVSPRVLTGRARALKELKVIPNGRMRDMMAQTLTGLHNTGMKLDSPNRLPDWWDRSA